MYVDVPPVHDAVKVGEYPDVTVFVPESVTITFVSSGLFDVSVQGLL